MTEVEIEKFEITDYDLENEFNPNRRRFRLTKNQQIYGVFAPDDGSDDDRPSFGRKDYTTPITFVGGGIQQSEKKPEKKEVEDPVDLISSDDDEPPPTISKPKPIYGAGRKQPRHISGFRGNAPEQEIGKWERHTKGIGLKLLLQQGYRPGKGLGKTLQGISEPVEAKQRKGRGAVGAYGSERTEQQLRQAEKIIDSEEEEDQDFKKQLGQWKKSEEGKKKIKYVYKTVDDVISEGGHRKIKGDTSHLSKVKVIDMTGPEQKVLSGYHAIHNQHSKPLETDEESGTKKYENFALPELMHNLDLLVDMVEQDIIQKDREIRFEKDQIVNLTHEAEKLGQVLSYENKQADALETLIKVVESLETRGKDGGSPLTLSEVAKILKDLQDNYYEEYKMYEMSDLAVGVVVPLLKRHFDNWNPLESASYGLEEVQKWKDILDTGYRSYSSEKMEPYDQLLWEAWMPHLRRFVPTWNSRNCHPLIEILENWMPLLPPWIMENILDQVVLPRLQQEVDDWNPLTDNVPIDAWIHPWLPLMGTRLEILYPPIRQKLANGLTNWHPSDISAKRILEPWKSVFSRGTMDAFLIKNVLPKLVLVMQEFTINPHQQLLDPWQWFMVWEDMMPVQSMVSLLDKHFFPKWLQVLCAWLGHSPNYDEVTKWYMGWKSMFPSEFLSQPTVKEQFNRALDVMNHAVSTPQGIGYQPGAREHVAYLASLERRRELENPPSQLPNRDYETLAQSMQNPSASLSMSFKELVERRAIDNGLVFIPVPKRFQEAKQVYRFGNVMIYIDRSVVFVQREHGWVPQSLQALVDLAKGHTLPRNS